jgi:hypothetical protein
MKYIISAIFFLGSTSAFANPARVIPGLLRPGKIHVDKSREDPKSKEFQERVTKERKEPRDTPSKTNGDKKK